MKNILISFIRNDHFEKFKKDDHLSIDISKIVRLSSIDKLFLLTNKNREQSIDFKNWIGEKLSLEVKAVTLEKGSENYLLNKIESIIKYILLAEEGHARFYYLPGLNQNQIDLWEMVNQKIQKGEIHYGQNQKAQSTPPNEKEKVDLIESVETIKKTLFGHEKVIEKKMFQVKAPQVKEEFSFLEKGIKSLEKGRNILICGEEGTGKSTLAKQIINKMGKKCSQINFRSINPDKIDNEFFQFRKLIRDKNPDLYLFLNIDSLPLHLQEQFTEIEDMHMISTFNSSENRSVKSLNQKFYYLISSTILSILPLRLRKKEFKELSIQILKRMNSKAILSEKALLYLQEHSWPGNFNEMISLLSRSSLETDGIITKEILQLSLDRLENNLSQWQNSSINENFNLKEIIGDVAMHYIVLALEKSEGKKSKAARMLGFSNYQTLGNWIKKYQK